MGRALVGIIAYQQILSQLLGGGDSPESGPPNPAKTYMDIWLRGTLKPDSPARRHSPEESTKQVPETAAWAARL